MTDAAVKVFVIEATAYCVSGVASACSSTSASPTASLHTSSPPRNTAAATLGSRPALCASRTRRRNRSGSGKGSERARDQLDSSLDLVVPHVEMGDGS